MRSFASVLAIALATVALGCQDAKKSSAGGDAPKAKASSDMPVAGEVIATVNGVPIGSEEYKEAAARKKPAEGNDLSDAERTEIIDRLVEEKLLYKAALEKGLDKDPKVQKVMVNTLLRDEVYNDIRSQEISEEELQTYFEVHKEDFVVPEKVQIKRILIKVEKRTDEEAKAEADRLYKILKSDPGKFKEVAAKNSEDPYRRRGGDVGFVAKTGKPGFDQSVVDKAFGMKVEQLSQPFKSESGWNIIYVANKRERVERTFQQMKGSVLRKVKNERLKELYEKYVSDLKTGAKIDVDDAKVKAVKVERTGKLGKGAKSKSLKLDAPAPTGGPEGSAAPADPQ